MMQTVSIEEVNATIMFHSLPMQFGETDLCITADRTQPFNYKCLHQKPLQSPQITPPTYIYMCVCVCVCVWMGTDVTHAYTQRNHWSPF